MLKNPWKMLKSFYNINLLIDHTYFKVIVNSIMWELKVVNILYSTWAITTII